MTHRAVVLLLVLGFLPAPARSQQPAPIRVAVYDDAGVSKGIENLLAVLARHPDLRVKRVKAADVRAGVLSGVDVLVHPGGTGGGQGKSLGAEGRDRVRAFVKEGGGYVGICAGAYLATRDYPWSLHILDAKVLDRAHWARGVGDVSVKLTKKGRELLGVKDETVTIYYHQGPLLAPAADPDIPAYETLGTFRGEIAKNGAPKGVMPGTTAIAIGTFGKGRVWCFSPHPERTPGLQGMVHRSIVWAANARMPSKAIPASAPGSGAAPR
jgi:putative intracellular protease/amidase